MSLTSGQGSKRPELNSLGRRLFRLVINAVSSFLIRQDSTVFAQCTLLVSRPLRRIQLVRRWVEEAQVSDPLAQSAVQAPIEVVMAVARKDLRTVELSLASCREHIRNEILKTTLVVTKDAFDEARKRFSNSHTFVVDERDFLPSSLLEAINEHFPLSRRGWVMQQVIGLWAAHESSAPGTLVLDSDTVFLKPISLLSSEGVQLLQFSHEYVEEYESHARKIWGSRKRFRGLSFVTHYQLMKPSVVREMFSAENNLEDWVRAGRPLHHSPVADYHSYGRFLADRHKNDLLVGRWGNKKLPWTMLAEDIEVAQVLNFLRERLPNYLSISFHTYLKPRRASS